MTKDETAGGRAEENVHRMTTSEVVRMVGGMLEWACREKGCKHGLRFPPDQIEAIPFFIVRHMLKDHGVAPAALAEMEPSLAGEVEEYCGGMGVGRITAP